MSVNTYAMKSLCGILTMSLKGTATSNSFNFLHVLAMDDIEALLILQLTKASFSSVELYFSNNSSTKGSPTTIVRSESFNVNDVTEGEPALRDFRMADRMSGAGDPFMLYRASIARDFRHGSDITEGSRNAFSC
jgi:hypothetical protein